MIRRCTGRGLGVVLFAVSMLIGSAATAQNLPPGGTFVDDDSSVHEGYIEAISAQGITRGCNPPDNDRYCPEDPVTRGQMAAFLSRALELEPSEEDHFEDDTGSVFEGDINALAEAEITIGCNPPDNDRFCPDDLVTRGQMAAFLVRGFGYTDAGEGDEFVDDNTSVFEEDIESLATAEVTTGCNPPENDRFCPREPVTRAQMASFLGRALNLTPRTPEPMPDDAQQYALATFDAWLDDDRETLARLTNERAYDTLTSVTPNPDLVFGGCSAGAGSVFCLWEDGTLRLVLRVDNHAASGGSPDAVVEARFE